MQIITQQQQNIHRTLAPAFALTLSLILCLSACTSQEPLGRRIEYYHPAFRQLPPEPVYSRLTWSHVPQPFPIKSQDDAPYLSPQISFELPHSTLGEALRTIAQTIGYEGRSPKELEKRRVSLKMVGSVDEILAQIGKRAGVRLELDRQHRVIRAIDERTEPMLPAHK